MNLAQIIEALPPRVYVRSGELVIHFSTPSDLLNRVAETQAAFSAIERPEPARPDARGRRVNPRPNSQSESSPVTEVENCTSGSGLDGKEN